MSGSTGFSVSSTTWAVGSRHSLPLCILRVRRCWRAAAEGQAAAFLQGRQAGENQEGELTQEQKKQLDRRLNHGDVLPGERERDGRGEVLEEQGKAGKEGSDDEKSLFP